jgi:hypothetical protein
MKKYSRSNVQKPGENFSIHHASKSSYYNPKNLKVKKLNVSKTIDRDTVMTHSSTDSKTISTSGGKKHKMQLSKNIKSKSRGNGSDISKLHYKYQNTKPTASQLKSYTNKSKKLGGSSLDKTNVSKASSSSKRRLNNSTSCNLIGLYEQNPSYPGDRKMSKYINAKSNVKDIKETNKVEEFSLTRRVNNSISQLSGMNRLNLSKSKTKKKKKKPSHIKSHSNIPMYHEQPITIKSSPNKQFSDSKNKNTKHSKHVHHQSETNVKTSFINKNNVLMIDSAIGIKTYINLPLSPNTGRAAVKPSNNVISLNAMVKGGIKEKTSILHTRALSDNYPYQFANNNHHIYTSGPSTLDGRGYKLKPKSKDKKPFQKTYDKRNVFKSPKLSEKYAKSKNFKFSFNENN